MWDFEDDLESRINVGYYWSSFCTFRELNRNRIDEIEDLSFQGLMQLESLKLRRNALRVLTDGTFFGLDRLLHL